MTKAMLKITKWIATILSVLLMVFLIAIIGLLFTNAGLNVLLWGAQQAVPQLQVATTQGALFPRFTLNQVAFIDDDLHLDLKAKRVTLAVNANCLFEPALCVQELAVIGLDFAMPELPPESDETQVAESEPVTAISTPVPITIGRVVLNDIKLDILGNKIAWQSFSTNASMFGNRLKIGKTSWNDIQLSLAPNEAESAMPTAAESERQPIVLPDVTIPLQVELMRFDINNFILQQAEPIVVNHLGLVANAYQHNVSLKALELDLPLLVANLKADVRLQGEYPFNLSLKSTIKQAEANGQTVALDAFGSVNDLTLDAKFGGLAQATLHAQLSPLDPELPFDIVLDDVQAQWPLIGQGDYFISVPTLKTQGSLQGYNLTLQTQLKGKDLPDVSLDVAGKGTLEQIALESLLVETLGGSVRGQAMANWQAPINWQAALTMQDIQRGF